MSLFKYGNLEAEIDFTDADFLDRIDEAKQNLEEDMKGIPKTGKAADIVRAQCQCFFNFFDIYFSLSGGKPPIKSITKPNYRLQLQSFQRV